jgi:hypothetical protein
MTVTPSCLTSPWNTPLPLVPITVPHVSKVILLAVPVTVRATMLTPADVRLDETADTIIFVAVAADRTLAAEVVFDVRVDDVAATVTTATLLPK